MPYQRLVSRRDFLKGGAAFLLGAPYVIPSLAGAAKRRVSPSNRIVMGTIGTGGQGTGDMGNFMWSNTVQMVAVCDVDRKNREDAQKKVEKHYSENKPGGPWKGCAAYNDFRELLAREDIDAVIIATPDHWHVPIAIAAARAGKDIYCEKPISLTIGEGRALCDVMKRTGRVLQTGSQQRSDGRFRQACELARNGRLGRLHTITTHLPGGTETGPQPVQPVPDGFDYDMWLGPAPWAPYTEKRCHWNFRWIYDYSGGEPTDWGAHHNDIAQWGNGTELTGPVEIDGKGVFPEKGLWNAPLSFRIEYRYANGVRLVCENGDPQTVMFDGDKGWVKVSREEIRAEPESLLREKIGPDEIRLYRSKDHTENFLDCVKSRKETVAPPEIAHRSATVCHLGNISMRLGRKLAWDPDRERFVNDPEADRMINRAMRAPWTL
jgi:predicted dehydrogenase